jgi:multiple sugar transport system substrate-binding protein
MPALQQAKEKAQWEDEMKGITKPGVVAVIAIAIIALGIAVVVGCGRKEEAGKAKEPEQGKTELTLFTWTREDEMAVNQQLLKEFEAQNPGIAVQIINVPGSGEAMAKLHTMTAGGQPPDVASIHGAFYYSFADAGALTDLEPLAKGDKDFKLEDFNPRIVDMCRWKGKLFSLPRYTSIYAMFYNKDMFDAAGVKYPQGEWTWDDYLKTVKALTQAGAGGQPGQYGCYIDFWGARLYPWLWQNGADLMDAKRERMTLDTPEAIEALQYIVDLRLKHKVTPQPTPGDKTEGIDLFATGKVATYISGPWDVGDLKKRATFRWDVWHLPKKKVRATMLGTENYAVMAGTKHPTEAWALYRFLLSPHAQQVMAEKMEKMPSRTSVLKGTYEQAKVAYNRKVFVDALDYAQPPPNIPEWDKVQGRLQELLDLVYIGNKTVPDGAREATAVVNRTLGEMRGKGK